MVEEGDALDACALEISVHATVFLPYSGLLRMRERTVERRRRYAIAQILYLGL